LLPVRLRRASVRSDGFTLVELIIVMLILGIILGGLTTSFISGTQTSANLNNEFQAEVQAVRAVDHIRRDVRCASAITPTGSASSITVTLPASCLIGSGQVSWCTVGSGNQYSLYRKVGSSCDATGALVIGNVTTASVFSYTAPVAGTSLGELQVDLPVNVLPATSATGYELKDTIVLLNTTR
jgi:prepilin-type N-terminal cleavage/methylation domain-containing protein